MSDTTHNPTKTHRSTTTRGHAAVGDPASAPRGATGPTNHDRANTRGSLRPVVALHFVKRDVMLYTPPIILGLVVLVTVIIALVLQRVGLDPSSPDWAEGARSNGGVVWSIAGFIVYLGVQSVGTTFPFALALGATRRNFTIGTLAAHFVLAVYIAAIGAVLLTIEKATGHWFTHAYTFDSYLLGSGRYQVLIPVMLLGSWAALSVGGAFGAVWVRFGKRGPLVVGCGLAVVLALALLVLAPSLGRIFANFHAWWLAVLAALTIVFGAVGQYGALRSASVR